MVAEGLSPARVRQARQVLHAALKVVVDDDLIARNPADRVKPPTVRPGNRPSTIRHGPAGIVRCPDELIFTAPKGGPLHISNFRRNVWTPACEASGMPEGLLVHDLRDTAASLAISAGASIKAVQRMLGHASAAMTEIDISANEQRAFQRALDVHSSQRHQRAHR
jgi:integrase